MFAQLSSLDTSRTSWKIKVRLTRMWPSVSSNSDASLKGYNLILLDDDNCHVHAFVYGDNWRAISDDMEEGGLYIISNFYTKEATGILRPTTAKIIINFSNSTTVQKLPVDDFMIPRHKFEFIDLGDLFRVVSDYDNENTPEFLTDIIGVLEDFENVKSIKTMYGDRKIVKFRITDGRYSHKVSVWGKLAVKTDEEYQKIEDKLVVVIVTSTKLKIFKNSVQISTLPSSKVYLNLDDEVVTAMKNRLEEEGYKAPENYLASPLPSLSHRVIETITLKELSEKTDTDDLNKKYLCLVNILTVEQGDKWWYYSCNFCQNDVLKLEARYKCVSCPKSIPVAEKRYKIVVLAGDSTEAFNFILMDKAAKRILGRTATKMLADNLTLEGTGEYPPNIKNIVGKELTFRIEISSDNVLLHSRIFNVIDAYDNEYLASSPSNASIGAVAISCFSEEI